MTRLGLIGLGIMGHAMASNLLSASNPLTAWNGGLSWLDAPVSGGSEGAENGTLAVMVGGPVEALDRVRPFLDAYSKSIVHVGTQPGSGQMGELIKQGRVGA